MWVGIVIAAAAIGAMILVVVNVRMVPQTAAYVIERFGAYKGIWYTGPHIKIPFIDSIAMVVKLKEQVADFPPWPSITRDNVSIMVDTVVFFQVEDPKQFAYGVERPLKAIETLTSTTLRNIIGEMDLDQTLTSRDIINTKMRELLDDITGPWGIRITRVELMEIKPPPDVTAAMEKQMKAEREKRETQLRAEGEADAILQVEKARAEAIKLINEANPGQAYVTLQSFRAFEKAADGKATKIIIPSEIQGMAGLAKGLSEVVSDK